MKNLTGTEKQIAYASDILKRFNDTIDEALTLTTKYTDIFGKYRDKVNAIERASVIIDCTKTDENYGIWIIDNMTDLKAWVQSEQYNKL